MGGKKNEIFRVEITDTIKSFRSEISSAVSFYTRELNLVSKYRQIKKTLLRNHKNLGKVWKKYEILRAEITDARKSLRRVLHLSL